MPYEKTGKETRCIADEIPFEIPDSWAWVCLEQICEYIQRGKSPKYSPIKKYPVIAQKCNQWSGFSIEKAQFIAPETIETYSPERFLRDRDLLWNSTGLGTLGRMAIYKNELNPYGIAVADSHVTVIRLSALVLPEFFFFYFANPSVQSVIEEQADGTTKQKELSRNTVRSYLTPLPPLAEQQRIVAKIVELLPHLDEYDQAETRVKRLTAEFPEQLKKSILQWAIQGKLVPQDPNDEPASVLLDRIRAEKAKLVKAGKLKKDKTESVIFRRDNSHYEKLNGVERCIDDEIPFPIPDSWAWVRLNGIYNFIDYRGKTPKKTLAGIPLITAKNVKAGYISYIPAEYISESEFAERKSRGISQKGDILFTTEAPLGNAAIADLDIYSAGQRIITFQQYGCGNTIDNQLILHFILSPYFQAALKNKHTGTTVAGIKAEKLKQIAIPLPPLAEQKRIVAEIEKILSLQRTMRR